MKTALNNVLLPALLNVVNNFLQFVDHRDINNTKQLLRANSSPGRYAKRLLAT